MRFQMLSTNATFFPDIILSTVRVPNPKGLDYSYETCLFTNGESEVLGQYTKASEAINHHIVLRKYLGLKETN